MGFFIICYICLMAKRLNNQPVRSRLITVAILTFAICLLMFIAGYPGLVERYYSNGFYRAVCFIFHPIFNLFPFSVGDVIYILIIGYLIYAAIKLIRLLIRKQWRPAGLFTFGLIIGVQV